jgi:hypothetical protein
MANFGGRDNVKNTCIGVVADWASIDRYIYVRA